VIADAFQGKKLNLPNDIVVDPDGGIWFTDPTYGTNGNSQGNRAHSRTRPRTYRVNPKTLAIEKVNDEAGQPNGLCFSPDYKKLQRPQKRDQISSFLRGEPDVESALVEVDDLVEGGGRAVVEIRRPSGKRPQH